MPALDVDLLSSETVDIVGRLAVDVGAMVVLLGLLAVRRRGGRDLITACAAFNAGLFAVAQVITTADIGVGAGFGLFAVLSIIRLRSELFDNTQLAYVFSTLALALATGIPGVPVLTGGLLGVFIVLTVAVVDAGRGRRPVSSIRITLDSVHRDRAGLVDDLQARLALEIVDVKVVEIDLVRETTVADVSARPVIAEGGRVRPRLHVEQR